MKNFVQEDELIEVTAPAGGVTSGDGVIVGALFGVAVTTAASGERVNLLTEGIFDLPKPTTTTFASCGAVSFNIATRECAAPGTGKYPIGIAIAPAGNGATTARVRLNGVATAAAS